MLTPALPKKAKSNKKKNSIKIQPAITIAFFTALALFITGCATNGMQENAEPELDLAKFATLTSHDAVTNLESSYQSSDINELAVYAPQHYTTAGKAIKDAKQLLKQSQPRNQIVQKVAVAEAVLKNGDMVMRRVKDILEDEISVKQKLDALNTESAYGAEYGSLNNRLNKLILKIESGIEADEFNREKLLKDMQQLERKSLRFNAMNEPREILKRVKNSGGPQLAPNTYNEALAVFKRADEFIKQNPNYDIGITQIGREALFAAKRALYITEGVSSLKQKIAFAPEQIILDEEYRMYRVARQLADLDYRDNSLEVQSEKLAEDAATLALELRNKDDLVIALRDTLIKVRDSSTRLTMLSDSAQKLKKEKNAWLAKEALFKAKVDQLAEELEATKSQLDSTQQTLLGFRSENTRLSQQAQSNANNTEVLESELAQLKLNAEATKNEDENVLTQSPAPSITGTVDASNNAAIKITENEAENEINTADTKQTSKIITASPVLNKDTAPTESIQATAIETETAKKIEPTGQQEKTALKEEMTTSDSTPKQKTPTTSLDVPPATPVPSQEIAASQQNIAVSASKKERAKITEQETLDAIQSAKELIKSLNETEHKLIGKQPSIRQPNNNLPKNLIPATFDENDSFLDDEDGDVFVDASE